MKTLELHYPMIQFLIIAHIPWWLSQWKLLNCFIQWTIFFIISNIFHQISKRVTRPNIPQVKLGTNIQAYFCAKWRLLLLSLSFSITGLDPAGPLHINVDAAFRLDEGDAGQVDVVHTDTEVAGTKRDKTVGHIDFFPNGGDKQPGCNLNGKLNFRLGKWCVH